MCLFESCRTGTTVFSILRTWILISTLAALVAVAPARSAVGNDTDEKDSSPPSVAETWNSGS